MNLFKVALVGLWVMRNLMFLYVISTGAGLFIRAIADNEKLDRSVQKKWKESPPNPLQKK